MSVVDNNHLLPQASLAPNQKGARAAPRAGYEPKPCLSETWRIDEVEMFQDIEKGIFT